METENLAAHIDLFAVTLAGMLAGTSDTGIPEDVNVRRSIDLAAAADIAEGKLNRENVIHSDGSIGPLSLGTIVWLKDGEAQIIFLDYVGQIKGGKTPSLESIPIPELPGQTEIAFRTADPNRKIEYSPQDQIKKGMSEIKHHVEMEHHRLTIRSLEDYALGHIRLYSSRAFLNLIGQTLFKVNVINFLDHSFNYCWINVEPNLQIGLTEGFKISHNNIKRVAGGSFSFDHEQNGSKIHQRIDYQKCTISINRGS